MKLKIASTALLILAIVVLILFMPLAVIWALNTLFTLSIPYTFWTWLAVVVMSLFARSGVTKS